MSFILDALKKSEMERQRQAIPGLIDSGAAQKARGLPLWAVGLVVLLGINLVVLLFVLTRGGTPAALAAGCSRTRRAIPGSSASRSVALPGRRPRTPRSRARAQSPALDAFQSS